MFEVDWTDYDRELVGERKARKELQKDRKKKEDTHSGQASVSTRSSSSSNEKPLGFFGSIGLKKRPYSSKARKPIPSAFFHSTKDGIKVEDGLDLIPEIPSNPSTSAERLSIETGTKSTSQNPTALTLNPSLDGFQAPWEDLQETPVRGRSKHQTWFTLSDTFCYLLHTHRTEHYAFGQITLECTFD